MNQHASLHGVETVCRGFRRIGELERPAGEELEWAFEVGFEARGREAVVLDG
jgi:hypothetical protein